MLKIFTSLIFALLLAIPLSAQCELEAEVSEITCDEVTGNVNFRLTVTGSGGVVVFTDFGHEFPLPLDGVFTIPGNSGDFVLRLSSENEDGDCAATVKVPENCEAVQPACQVHISEQSDDCGAVTRLVAEASGTAPFSYTWSNGDTTATTTADEPYTSYSVTVTDADGCVAYGNYYGDPCEGEEPSLTASAFGATGALTYLWSTGETTQTIDADPEVVYSVTVTDENGCVSEGEGLYHPGAFGRFLHTSGPGFLNCDGSPVTLSVENPDPNLIYYWISNGDTLTGSTITTDVAGYYDVLGVDPGNPECTSTGSYYVNNTNVTEGDISPIFLGDPCSEHVCLGLFLNGSDVPFFYEGDVVWLLDGEVQEQLGGGFACFDQGGDYEAVIATGCDTLVLPVSIDIPAVDCIEVCGTVIMDDDQDCEADTEPMDWNTMIALLTNESTGIAYPVHFDDEGNYCANLPKGIYSVTVLGGQMVISTDCEVVEPLMDLTEGDVSDMELFADIAQDGDAEDENATTSLISTVDEVAQLRVYPNPSAGALTIDLERQSSEVTDVVLLYDGLGRLLQKTSVADLPTPWEPAGVKPGVHQLVLTDRGGHVKARSTVVFR